MASLVLAGDTSGSITVSAPAVAGSNTQTLPAVSGTIVVGSAAVSAAGQIPFSTDGATFTPTAKIVSGTSVTASGASVDFTSIPSWVKRITLMLNGVSTNGTSDPLIQLGDSGGVEITGYVAGAAVITAGSSGFSSTAGFPISGSWSASVVFSGIVTLVLQDAATNTWTAGVSGGRTDSSGAFTGGGYKSLSATLDRVRITTAGGVNTFDAGTINILYE